MKKLLRVVIALAAFATAPAMSADLEPSVFQHPAPPPVLIATATWTGCYLGGNAGFGWSNWTYSNASDNPTVPGERGNILANDVVAGGQVGCDYQSGGLVLGVQGLFDWAQMKGRFHDAVTGIFDETAQSRWFGTATGRVGYAATPTSLFYAKGGAAWINNKYQDIGVAGSFICGGGPCNTVDSSPTSTRLGWTVGLGFEYMLSPNWSVFVEYDYMNFGNPTISFPGTVPVNSFQIAQHVQTVMIGLNLRLNLGPAPVVATRY
jgi:outer membrane immunogenic protein